MRFRPGCRRILPGSIRRMRITITSPPRSCHGAARWMPHSMSSSAPPLRERLTGLRCSITASATITSSVTLLRVHGGCLPLRSERRFPRINGPCRMSRRTGSRRVMKPELRPTWSSPWLAAPRTEISRSIYISARSVWLILPACGNWPIHMPDSRGRSWSGSMISSARDC